MAAPKLDIPCCMCGKPLPRTKDNIRLLDAEWQRRFPDMTGSLCCFTCVSRNYWSCRPHGTYVDGHIPATDEFTGQPTSQDNDALHHLGTPGRLAEMVQAHPSTALTQGGESAAAYLRHRAGVRTLPRGEKVRLVSILESWDTAEDRQEEHAGLDQVDLSHWNTILDSTTRKLASARRKLAARETEMAHLLDSARAAGVPPNVLDAWEVQADTHLTQVEDAPVRT